MKVYLKKINSYDEQKKSSDLKFNFELNRRKSSGLVYDKNYKTHYFDTDSLKFEDLILEFGLEIDEDITLNESRSLSETTIGNESNLKFPQLSYWKDVLALTDLDSLYVSRSEREKMFPDKKIISFEELNRGIINIDQKYYSDFMIGELGSRNNSFIPRNKDLISEALLIFGDEWGKKGKNDIITYKGNVFFAIPVSLINISNEEEGFFAVKLLPAERGSIIINTKHLESLYKKAHKPILGKLNENEDDIKYFKNSDFEDWGNYWEAVNKEFQNLEGNKKKVIISDFKWQNEDKNEKNEKRLTFLGIVPSAVIPPANRKLVELISTIQFQSGSKLPALLDKILKGPNPVKKNASDWKSSDEFQRRCSHVGHMGDKFGLDSTQRKALWQTTIKKDLNLCAVSGPPGTGKTSMLQGVIATIVVDYTLNNKKTVIFASSQTNQATTNMIKAFSEIAKPLIGEKVNIDNRWIDKLPSYGWYAPAASQVEKYGNDQLLVKPARIFNLYEAKGAAKEFGSLSSPKKEWIDECRDTFLKRFRSWQITLNPSELCNDLDSAEAFLINRLKKISGEEGILSECLSACDSLVKIRLNSIYKMEHVKSFGEKIQRIKAKLLIPISKPEGLDDLINQKKLLIEKLNELQNVQSNFKKLVENIKVIRSRKPRLLIIFDLPVLTRIFIQKQKIRNSLLVYLINQNIKVNGESDQSIINSIESKEEEINESIFKLTNLIGDIERKIKIANNRNEKNKKIIIKIINKHKNVEDLYLSWLKYKELISYMISFSRGDEARIAFLQGIEGQDFNTEEFLNFYKIGEKISTLLDDCLLNINSIDEIREQNEILLDLTLRYYSFHLSMRIREAQWINISDLNKASRPTPREALERVSLLAPVIVATTQSMSDLALFEQFHKLEIADWLILDEAGQISPHYAGPLFALAKNALVVGDLDQLRPIVTFESALNQKIKIKYNLNDNKSSYEANALDSYSGDIMSAALEASDYHDDISKKRYGVMLRYHYRCRRSIIEFCNQLVYGRSVPLIPMVPDPQIKYKKGETNVENSEVLPPMSFVEVEGDELKQGGSLFNQKEVQAIVDWFHEYRDYIESAYNKKIEEVVAVIAPYASQVEKITDALQAIGISTDKSNIDESEVGSDKLIKMVIGTVHSLQGAEKPIVLFSFTSSINKGRLFIDSRHDMLNVAVSRAKHSFVLFGNPETLFNRIKNFNKAPSTILSQYMLNNGFRLYPRNLVVIEAPGKLSIFNKALGVKHLTIASGGHFRELSLSNNGDIDWKIKENKAPFLESLNKFLARGERHYDNIILATDDDREGEVIAWHVIDVLKSNSIKINKERFLRMRFYAMDEMEIKRAREFATKGVDVGRVRASIARTVADMMIAQKIQNISNYKINNVGRVAGAMLDFIDKEQRKRSKKIYKEVVEVQTSEGRKHLFTRVEGPSPFSKIKFFDNEGNFKIEKNILEVEEGKINWNESLAPATSTATILSFAVRHLKMDPGDVMNSLQNIYEGKSIED